MKRHGLLGAIYLTLICFIAAPLAAQDTLPRPDPPFKGKIDRTV